eukprot:GFUD01034890.1.p1 GENE.GFUD01034890.1~~GFUD01034890.1.p1  ORF type:complete len:459 (-),score=121.00 GFUD01034890.1:15-1391(-)
MDDNKDKKMKIKINFKPYIPKRKNGNKRKQDPPEFKFNKERKLHQSLKDEKEKAVIKVVDIDLLKDPKQVGDSSEEEVICIDIDKNLNNVVADNSTESQQQENNKAHECSINVSHFNNWQINNDNEPLDLSRKGVIPQTSPLFIEDPSPLFIEDPSPLFIEDPSPLDLSRTREQPQSFNVGEPPPLVPIERIGQEFAQTIPVFSIRGNHLNQCKTFHPFCQSVQHPFPLAKPDMQDWAIESQSPSVLILQPFQSVLTGSSFFQAGPDNIFLVQRPPSPASRDNSTNHKIIPVGKISRRKSTKTGIYPQHISETQLNCIEPSKTSLNKTEYITDIKHKKKSIAKQIIEVEDKASLNVKAKMASPDQHNCTESPFSPTSSSKSNYQKEPVKNRNIPNGNTLKIKQKPSKIPSNIQTGMIKINEKITSCGAVFCTFRNVARKETRTVKSEEKTKKKKKVAK